MNLRNFKHIRNIRMKYTAIPQFLPIRNKALNNFRIYFMVVIIYVSICNRMNVVANNINKRIMQRITYYAMNIFAALRALMPSLIFCMWIRLLNPLKREGWILTNCHINSLVPPEGTGRYSC